MRGRDRVSWLPVRERAVFRNSYIAGMAGVVIAVTAVLFVLGAHSQRNGIYVTAVIYAVCICLIWVVAWHSAIRVDDRSVLVDNAFGRHVVPFSVLSSIDVDLGIKVRTTDGETIESFAFMDYVAVSLVNSEYLGEVCREIRREADRRASLVASSDVPAERHVTKARIPWAVFLLIVAGCEAIAFAAPYFW